MQNLTSSDGKMRDFVYSRIIPWLKSPVVLPITAGYDGLTSTRVKYCKLYLNSDEASPGSAVRLLHRDQQPAVRIGLLYLISGFGGSLLSALFIQSNISVGASGAVFGLLGGMLSELITNWTIYANKVTALLILVVIIVINLGVGILPHVDNFAHLGGFASGFLLGFVFLIRPQFGWVGQRYGSPGHSSTSRPKFKMYQCILWVISLILLISGLITGLVLLLRGVDLNDNCSWCHYLSCVPTSRWSCNTKPISCMSEQTGNQLSLTCSNNGKTNTYPLLNATASEIRGLCSQLCR
ncbi:hypothetical protein RJ639_032214 [Escallonia herrerae]|uniref:RHOMBOID-like protein n=1 Tax=Escallonia herrerae TaxID=1293975 RepID=A0AA88WWL1_9ASTE|nr:hypothetical protein RJ639_032214 [Escallonia herrerae]